MPRLQIRNFSGGLVTNQSEFDISENQYTAFENVINNVKDNFVLDDILLYLKENKSVVDINYFREDDWKKNQEVLN